MTIHFTSKRPDRCGRLFSAWNLDEFSESLDTCFCRFESPTGIHGLARATDDTLDLLALFAFVPGRGSFKRFLKLAERRFATIRVLSVWNERLAGFLARRGYIQFMDLDPNGDKINGLILKRESIPPPKSPPLI